MISRLAGSRQSFQKGTNDKKSWPPSPSFRPKPVSRKYDGSQIVILEGLEAVRKRPGMYIGSTGTRGLHHLIWEILDNGIDEHLAGYCTQLGITLTRDGGVVIEEQMDEAFRWISIRQKKIPTVRVVYTILHAGGKFNNSVYKVSGGLHGVGASVVNALSKSMIVEVKKDGKVYRDEYKDGGKPVVKLENGLLPGRRKMQ